jgi:hypothetical protein
MQLKTAARADETHALPQSIGLCLRPRGVHFAKMTHMKFRTSIAAKCLESHTDPKCYQSVYSGLRVTQKPLQTVELRRFELLTSSMRTKRSTN